MTDQKEPIDSTIQSLDQYIKRNRRSARFVWVYMFILMVLPMLPLAWAAMITMTVPSAVLYPTLGVFIVVFGVMVALYRFYLNEISKAEHYKLALMRIRIVVTNSGEGFPSDVREALTARAFDYSGPERPFSRGKQVESPLPGHPTSDLTAMVLNKLLEGYELRRK